ncbi:hypothetical protein LguiA_007529 [Lonicera macranthoides]
MHEKTETSNLSSPRKKLKWRRLNKGRNKHTFKIREVSQDIPIRFDVHISIITSVEFAREEVCSCAQM